MMELTCGFVLLIVGCATANPYGYGTKGGAAAKADASAIAGAYTGAGDIPINIPSGTGFSGSFSKSYSSSSASSSASSSSSSFSYSGASAAAYPGLTGGIGAKGCESGSCNGDASTGAHGAAAAGSQTYSSANAATLAGGFGSKISSGNQKYDDKGSQGCGNGGCQENKDSLSLTGTVTQTGSQSNSKSKALAGAASLSGANCGGSECNKLPGNNMKCLSGDCGAASSTDASTSHYESDKKCTSGKCESNLDSEGNPSDYGTNDIQVSTSGVSSPKSNYANSNYANPGVASGCANGNCKPPTLQNTLTNAAPHQGPLTKSEHPTSLAFNKPAAHLTTPKLEPACTSANCQNSKHISSSEYGSSQCASGNCGTSSSQENNSYQNFKPSYSHGSSPSYSSAMPLGPGCAPGTPGCASAPSASGLSNCASGNCGASSTSPGYSGPLNVKPNYSHGSSPSYSSATPLGPGCAPGTPGCASTPSASGPSNCASGNCGTSPTSPGYSGSLNVKPSYSHGSSPTYSSTIPSGPGCAPGTPGCTSAIKTNGPSNCASGNCGTFPTSPGYSGSPSVKPGYSQGSSPSYSPAIPLRPPCVPGFPGCSSVPLAGGPPNCASGNCGSSISSLEYSGFPNVKPSYFQGNSPSFPPAIPVGPNCAPSTPGCNLPPAGAPSNCASGNCHTTSSSYGHSISPNGKPSYSQGSLPSHSPAITPGLACASGTPGCSQPTANGPSYCASGNCGISPSSSGFSSYPNSKPSYISGSLPSYSPVIPSEPMCAPGTPGCAKAPFASGPSNCASGNCGSHSYPQGCALGTPGCSVYGQTGTGISAPGYGASGLGSSSAHANFGSHSVASIHSSYNKPSTGFPPASSTGMSYTSGTGLGSPPSLTAPFAVQPSHNDFGTNKPSDNAPSSSSCKTQNCNSGLNNVGATSGNTDQGKSKDDLPLYTGGFGGPAGILKPNEFSASSPTYSNKPIIATSPTEVKPSCSAGNCEELAQASLSRAPSGSSTGAQAIAGTDTSTDAVEYTGGFGGPAGILNPHELKAPSSTYNSKPIITTSPSIVKPSCTAGHCEQPASPAHAHIGSNTGAQTVSGAAAASASAVVYTGGFGGPPGFLKPYDDGKIVLKGLPKNPSGSSLGLHQGFGGNDIHSTLSNSESKAGANAGAQANAATISTAGVTGHSHGNNGAGGCKGGCSGSGGSTFGYSGSLGHSTGVQTGGLDESSSGLAGTGAVAKSIANVSSDARAFGGSYASSSATAHAAAGASVKGGYGG